MKRLVLSALFLLAALGIRSDAVAERHAAFFRGLRRVRKFVCCGPYSSMKNSSLCTTLY